MKYSEVGTPNAENCAPVFVQVLTDLYVVKMLSGKALDNFGRWTNILYALKVVIPVYWDSKETVLKPGSKTRVSLLLTFLIFQVAPTMYFAWFLYSRLTNFLETVDDFAPASAWELGHITVGVYSMNFMQYRSRFIWFFKQATWITGRFEKMMKTKKVGQKIHRVIV